MGIGNDTNWDEYTTGKESEAPVTGSSKVTSDTPIAAVAAVAAVIAVTTPVEGTAAPMVADVPLAEPSVPVVTAAAAKPINLSL